jgi:hypothetical protein
VTIEQFEADLKGNLYKIWNRMSSGLLPAACPLRLHSEEGGRSADSRDSYRCESRGADCRQTPDRTGTRRNLSGRFLWLQARQVRPRCRERQAGAMLEIRLGSRVRHHIRQYRPRASATSRPETCEVRMALLYAERWLTAPMQQEVAPSSSEAVAPRRVDRRLGRARDFLAKIARENRRLFEHWQLGNGGALA